MIDIIAKLRQEKADEEASPRGCKLAMEEQGKPYPCAHDCPCALRALALTQADRIKALEAQLKATLDREAATYIRHDARIEALEADLNTAIAAAYEAAAQAEFYYWSGDKGTAARIRAMTPADAIAARDADRAEAEQRGYANAMEAERKLHETARDALRAEVERLRGLVKSVKQHADEWAISRMTGSKSLEQQKADLLWQEIRRVSASTAPIEASAILGDSKP